MSAWIEINVTKFNVHLNEVALLVSAWIEITITNYENGNITRRTPRECVD